MRYALALALLFGHPALAADLTPEEELIDSNREIDACKARCAEECRAKERDCQLERGPSPSCRAQLQICARRCVVSCAR